MLLLAYGPILLVDLWASEDKDGIFGLRIETPLVVYRDYEGLFIINQKLFGLL